MVLERGGGTGCPAFFSYRNLFFAHLFPDALDVRIGLVVLDDLRLSDIRDPESAGDLPVPPFAFPLLPDLLRGGCLNDFKLWPVAEATIEDDQEDHDNCYFKNVIKYYVHAITPCSDIIQESCRKVNR